MARMGNFLIKCMHHLLYRYATWASQVDGRSLATAMINNMVIVLTTWNNKLMQCPATCVQHHAQNNYK